MRLPRTCALCLALAALLCAEQAAAGSLRPIGTVKLRSMQEQQPVRLGVAAAAG